MSVKTRIGRSSEQVDLGIRLVANVEVAIGRVIQRVGSMTTLATDIADNIEQQSLALQQITAAVAELDNVTQQNAAVAEEETAAARKLADATRAMTGQIEQFRFTDWDVANGILPERDRQPRVVWPQRAPVDMPPRAIVTLKQHLA